MNEADLLNRVRDVSLDDVEQIARIHTTSYLEANARLLRPVLDNTDFNTHFRIQKGQWSSKVRKATLGGNTTVLGSFNEQGLEGFIHFGPHSKDSEAGYIEALYVDPDNKGTGIGSRLFQEAAKAMKEEGYKKAKVRAWADDPIPNRFYRKMGFDLTPLFKKMRGMSEVEYEMDLESLDI